MLVRAQTWPQQRLGHVCVVSRYSTSMRIDVSRWISDALYISISDGRIASTVMPREKEHPSADTVTMQRNFPRLYFHS